MAVNVVGQKCQRVVVVAGILERAARVHPDKEGGVRPVRLGRFLCTAGRGNTQDASEYRSNVQCTVHEATFLGCHATAGSSSRASTTSLRLLNGMLKTGLPMTRIMAKFNKAAAT